MRIFDFTTLFASCTDYKNNLEQLFNFSTKVIRHKVKTSYCCDILFVTSYFTLIYIAFIFVHKSNLVYFKTKIVDQIREFMCSSHLVNTCRNNRPYGFLLTVKTFAFQNLNHGLILNNW